MKSNHAGASVTARARVGAKCVFEFVEITPEAVACALVDHPGISRVWFNDETGEFAALTDAGMAIFRLELQGGPKAHS